MSSIQCLFYFIFCVCTVAALIYVLCLSAFRIRPALNMEPPRSKGHTFQWKGEGGKHEQNTATRLRNCNRDEKIAITKGQSRDNRDKSITADKTPALSPLSVLVIATFIKLSRLRACRPFENPLLRRRRDHVLLPCLVITFCFVFLSSFLSFGKGGKGLAWPHPLLPPMAVASANFPWNDMPIDDYTAWLASFDGLAARLGLCSAFWAAVHWVSSLVWRLDKFRLSDKDRVVWHNR